MANEKISQMPPITGAALPPSALFPVVDPTESSAADRNKSITKTELSVGVFGAMDFYKNGAVLSLRDGESSQSLEVYKTYTDASNYERAVFGFEDGSEASLIIGTAADGTGYPGAVKFRVGSVNPLELTTDGYVKLPNQTVNAIGSESLAGYLYIQDGSGTLVKVATLE